MVSRDVPTIQPQRSQTRIFHAGAIFLASLGWFPSKHENILRILATNINKPRHDWKCWTSVDGLEVGFFLWKSTQAASPLRLSIFFKAVEDVPAGGSIDVEASPGGFQALFYFSSSICQRRWTKEQLQSKCLKAPWPGSIAAFVHHGAAKFADPQLALSQKDREGLGAKPPWCAVCLWWSAEEQKVPALHMPSRLWQDCCVNALRINGVYQSTLRRHNKAKMMCPCCSGL